MENRNKFKELIKSIKELIKEISSYNYEITEQETIEIIETFGLWTWPQSIGTICPNCNGLGKIKKTTIEEIA